MKKMIVLLLVLVAMIFASCQNEYAGATDCSDFDKNRQILKHMRDWYYWYETIDPSITYTTFDEPQKLLTALKYNDGAVQIDHFSYLLNKQDHDDYYAGKYYGLGYGQKTDAEGRYFISMVYPDSPAGIAGLRRGMQLLAVNGTTVIELNENKQWNADHKDDEDFIKKTDWTTVYGENELGVTVTLTVVDNETERDLAMQKDEVTIKSVLATTTFDIGATKVGYLAFKAFISPSSDELDVAFADFEEKGVEWLILDMRYNGGGYLSVAEHLASLIKGEDVSGKSFIKLEFNDKHFDRNSNYNFQSLSHSLSIKKIAFITTRGTASASESVISGLKPYISDMAIIGSTTYGKPVGMNATDICDMTLVPITFLVLNASRWSDYFHGMEADCAADDDFTHDFGNPDESSLKEAIQWLKNGECSPEALKVRSIAPQQQTELNAELPNFYRFIGTL